MQLFIKLATYLFHPMWMPTFAVLIYMESTPLYLKSKSVYAYLLFVILLTIVIPLFFLALLKWLKLIDSFDLPTTHQRKLPLLFFTTIVFVIVNYVFTLETNKHLFFFFSGVFFSGLLATLFTFARFKVSLHMIGVGGLAVFVTAYQIGTLNFEVYQIAIFIAVLGWTASSRLYFKAHRNSELLVGFILGILPQAYFASLWLP
ncbi:MAG: hypothetical protein ACQESK_04170 [Bacteroidota bacterium]